MRKSKNETAQTREAIVTAAADQLRRVGIAGASLADIMAEAGLTHGGFYRHFRNKEHLVAEALSRVGKRAIAFINRQGGKGALSDAIESYFSMAPNRTQIPSCPFVAFGSEMARAGVETKAAAADVLKELIADLAGGEGQSRKTRNDVIAALSLAVGSITLARAVADSALADEILAAAKSGLGVEGQKRKTSLRRRKTPARPYAKASAAKALQSR